jgi:hypothetical protein
MRYHVAASIFLVAALSGVAQDASLLPNIVDHHARVDSAADVRFLLDAPAGKHGFITVRDGHLYTPDGTMFRMWGVNITGWTVGSALLPPHKDSEAMAAELARLGVNCVRFQFLDLPNKQELLPRDTRAAHYDVPTTYTPAGLIEADRDDTRVMNKDQLDKLDYLIYQLKLKGIYVDFNLNVGRQYKKGDGVQDYSLIGVAKAITYFDPRLIELEKEYAKQLLTHHNPYTNTSYNDEPAIAIVEILNENSILEFWQRNWFRGKLVPDAPHDQLDLTPYHKTLLTNAYNQWLKRTMAGDKLAELHSLAHVSASENVPLLMRQQFDEAPKERFYAEAAFYSQLETNFLEEMRSYIKQTLGVKSLITGTNDHTYFIPGMPLLRTTSRFDIVDAHVYWQHPAISGRRNTPMVNDPLHSIEVKLTRSNMVGKPFIVSEVNEPFPSDYGSELIPVLAAYGAFQDWDGIFFYSLEPKVEGKWEPVIGSYFDIAEDPVKIAQLPAGALLFLRHDVATAKQTVERTYSTEQINESMRLSSSELPYWTPGFPLSIPLEHESRIRCLDCEATPKFTDERQNPIVSDTHELAWKLADKTGDGVVTIDTDRSAALVGFVKENGAATSHLSADIRNEFCAISLSSLDKNPISRSSLLLLTTSGRAENTGMVWNARRTNVDVWGTAPTRIESIKGWLLLKDIEGAVGVSVTPLDGTGRPLTKLAGRQLESGWEIEIGDVPANTYLIEVRR